MAARDLHALAPRRFVGGYGALIVNRLFIGPALATGFLIGGLFAFVTEGPFLMIDRLGVATQDYGLYYAFMIGAFFLSSLTVNRLVKRVAVEVLLRLGLAIQAAATAALLAVVSTGLLTPWSLMLPVSAGIFGLGWVMATAPVRAFAAARGGAGGQASAMLGFLQMAGGAVGAQLVALFHDGTALPFTAVFAGSVVFAIATYFLARRAPA